MFQKLTKLNKDLFFILLFLTSFFSLQFVVDIKSLIFVFASFALVTFLFFDFSIKEILFFVLILSFSFEKGIRGWNFSVVADGRENWMNGFSFYYGLSLRVIIILTLFLLSFPDLMKSFGSEHSAQNKKIKTIFWILITFVFFAFLSTVFSSDYFLSLFGFLRLLQAVFLFFITLSLFGQKKFKKYFFISLTCLLFFNGFLSLLQYFNQGPVGWFLEDAVGHNNLGFFTSDGDRLYRSSGLSGHPTFFASFVSMLIPISVGFLINSFKKNRKNIAKLIAVTVVVIIGFLSIYTTFVRSSWGAVGFYMAIFTLFLIKNYKKSFRVFLNKYRSYLYLFFVGTSSLFLFFGKTFFGRLASSINFLSSGSGVIRIALIEQAIIMIKNFPFLGVGFNLNPRAMLQQSILPPNLRGFMFPVHNTFILFFAELGVPAGILFIVFLITILICSFKFVKKDILSLGVWLGVIGFILNAQVHTLFNHDASFDLLFMLLGFLTLICRNKKLR